MGKGIGRRVDEVRGEITCIKDMAIAINQVYKIISLVTFALFIYIVLASNSFSF